MWGLLVGLDLNILTIVEGMHRKFEGLLRKKAASRSACQGIKIPSKRPQNPKETSSVRRNLHIIFKLFISSSSVHGPTLTEELLL
jgi:hypothetical protein